MAQLGLPESRAGQAGEKVGQDLEEERNQLTPLSLPLVDEGNLREVEIVASEQLQNVEGRIKALGEEECTHLLGCGGWPLAATRTS